MKNSTLLHYVVKFISLCLRAARKIVRKFRAALYTMKIDEGGGYFDFRSPFFRLKINKHPTAILEIRGCVGCESFLGGDEIASILLQEGSRLIIEGDFDIGSGVRISCAPGAILRIGGRQQEAGSGITASSIILCKKNINIGYDFICSWGVFISDSDSHAMVGRPLQSDVVIGNHVWLCHSVSILKGAIIGNGVIVASHSLVNSGKYTVKSLLAGVPAKVVRTEVYWHR